MQQKQFIDIVKDPSQIKTTQLSELENLISEYPFFETAHLLYAKGLHKYQSINYSKQLRKTAILANSRSVLYELLHKIEVNPAIHVNEITETQLKEPNEEPKKSSGSISVTNNDVKVIYVSTVPNSESVIKENKSKQKVVEETVESELNIVKNIENETEAPSTEFDIDKLNKTIEQEISKEIVQSYVQTDIIKTPELAKEERTEPSSFTDWLKTIQKESHTFQIDTKKDESKKEESYEKTEKITEKPKKETVFDKNRQIIDKIIESDPGRIKLGTNKFFTPNVDAKQSLLENEHLVTETLAKIYALQGNISKAIRAYEILSLKFPQKSVYFASLIEKLKNNK